MLMLTLNHVWIDPEFFCNFFLDFCKSHLLLIKDPSASNYTIKITQQTTTTKKTEFLISDTLFSASLAKICLLSVTPK